MCIFYVGTLSVFATGFGNFKNVDVDVLKLFVYVLNIFIDVVSVVGLVFGIVSNRSSSDNNSVVVNKFTFANVLMMMFGCFMVVIGVVDVSFLLICVFFC